MHWLSGEVYLLLGEDNNPKHQDMDVPVGFIIVGCELQIVERPRMRLC